jgi:hypothetical protein
MVVVIPDHELFVGGFPSFLMDQMTLSRKEQWDYSCAELEALALRLLQLDNNGKDRNRTAREERKEKQDKRFRAAYLQRFILGRCLHVEGGWPDVATFFAQLVPGDTLGEKQQGKYIKAAERHSEELNLKSHSGIELLWRFAYMVGPRCYQMFYELMMGDRSKDNILAGVIAARHAEDDGLPEDDVMRLAEEAMDWSPMGRCAPARPRCSATARG